MSVDIPSLGNVATAVIAMGGAAAILWKPVKVAARFFRMLGSVGRAVHGVLEDPQRPGSGSAGLLSRVDAIGAQGAATAAAVAVIQHEVQHNRGGSIKDAVKRLEEGQLAISERLGTAQTDRLSQTSEIKSDIATLSTRLDNHIDTNAGNGK